MHQNIVVYPTKGFLNTDYQIRTEKAVDFSIHFNGKKFYQGNLSKGGIHTLPRLKNPGEYTILCKIEDEEVRHTIQVEDALRLGSSELKKAYVFDEFQHIVFVMKDRTHFFDPTLSACVYTENFLSPQDVYCINAKLLLFVTKHSEGTSISLFNADCFSLNETLECDAIIAHTLGYRMLFIKRGNNIIRIDAENHLNEVCFYKLEEIESESYWVDETINVLYIISKQYVHCIELNSGEEEKTNQKKDAIGITKNGYIIYYSGGSIYEYKCLLPKCNHEGRFTYKHSYNRLYFEGHPIENKNWGIYNDYGFETYYEATKDKLKEELKKLTSEKTNRASKPVFANDSSARLNIYPSSCGVYIQENVGCKEFTSINYLADSDYLYYSSRVINIETYLLWTGKDSFQVRYRNHSCSSNSALIIKESYATIAISETTSVLLENGLIKTTFEGALTASKEISGSIEKVEDEIIIDDEKIFSYYILCKDKNKLVYKHDGQYEFYMLDDRKAWKLQGFIPLAEQKYERAALSPDGKYVLYTKGSNQYALYDVESQKEETIYTGNFIDFDKDGNHIVSMTDSNKKRQLRIYNPKTFEWVNELSQFYSFVSPDGNLYAKTNLMVKVVNRINNKEVTREEYDSFVSEYDFKSNDYKSKEDLEAKRLKRKQFIERHEDYFEERLKEYEISVRARIKNDWICREDFSIVVFREVQFVVIGICNTKTELEIELHFRLDYLNYVSFSPDNKYIAIVGKPGSRGYLKIVSIDFNKDNNELKIIEPICDMIVADWATWTCAFNKNNMFATYDSNPNLYLIDQDGYAKFNEENSHNFNFIKTHFCIPDRSFMCFSTSGKYMALSEQGYRAKSLGGIGHIPSNKMYIYSTDGKFQKLDEWDYQGERISISSNVKKNLVQAGFSANDDKIMTVSADGVVVIRNLHLEESNKKLHFSNDSAKKCYNEDFAGTYAHDIAGLDADTINDAFEGEPDSYWNID